MAYEMFAQVYDQLTGNVDYPARAAYLDRLIRSYAPGGKIVLDLACGTGSLTVALDDLGYDMIGADPSQEMLAQAQEKNALLGKQILYLCQGMENLDLYGTVDAVVCMLDSVNHVTDPARLKKGFERVSLFLHPDGVFLFDVNTLYKQREILGDNAFVYDLDEVFCVWQNQWLPQAQSTRITLDFFFPLEEEGIYERETEEFEERVYSHEQLSQMLEDSGLKIQAVYGEDSLLPPGEEEQRLIYVVKKRKGSHSGLPGKEQMPVG